MDLLRPGGTLLYATCSVEVEENESNAHWASEELGLDLLIASRVEVAALPGDSPSIYRDASFAAQLRIS